MDPHNETNPTDRRSSWVMNFNTIFGVGFVVVSIVLFLIIPDQIAKPKIVFANSGNDLDASFFPQLVAGGFGILGVWLFFISFSIDEVNEVRLIDWEAFTNIAVTLLAMAVFIPLLTRVGFVISCALVIAFLSTFFGNRNYLLTAVVSITVPVAIFYIFTKLLATYLPPFPIDTILTRLFIL